MLHKYGHPCLRLASECLRRLAIKEVDPAALAALAHAQMENEEGADRQYWMKTLTESMETNSLEARMSLCS